MSCVTFGSPAVEQLWLESQASVGQTHAIAGDALVCRAQAAKTRDHPNPRMPTFDQMVDQIRGRPLVFTPDLVEMVPGQAVDKDSRQVMLGEVPQGVSAAVGAGGDQHPVDAPLLQSAHDPQLAVGVLLR